MRLFKVWKAKAKAKLASTLAQWAVKLVEDDIDWESLENEVGRQQPVSAEPQPPPGTAVVIGPEARKMIADGRAPRRRSKEDPEPPLAGSAKDRIQKAAATKRVVGR